MSTTDPQRIGYEVFGHRISDELAIEIRDRLLETFPLDGVVVDPSASAADIATQLRTAGARIVVLTMAPRGGITETFAEDLDNLGWKHLAAEVRAQTRLPEPEPVSNERAAELIRYHCEHESISRADSAELLRFADQLEADRG